MDAVTVKFDNNPDVEILSGLKHPSRITSHLQDEAMFLCDSHNRSQGTSDDFTCKISGGYQRCLSSQVTRVIFPLCPNINALNNQITIKSTVGTFSCTLDIGFYNQISILTELKNKIDASFGGLDTFTLDYKIQNRTISITSDLGNKFFFDQNCSFIVRGIHMLGFEGKPLSDNPSITGALNQISSQVGLVYTRYLNIHSNALCRFSRTNSVTPLGRGNCVSIVSLPELNQGDFDSFGLYTGISKVNLAIDNSVKAHLALNNSLLSEIDIALTDEFGFAYRLSSSLGEGVSNFSILVWIKFYL
jgi:hypothetical protein